MGPPVINLTETLQQHVFLSDEIHALLLEENRILQTTRKPPCEAFLERKRDLLPRLDAARRALQEGRIHERETVPAQAVVIERLQRKTLSILLLDRENEKLLLKYSVQPAGFRMEAKPRPHFVQRAYSAARS